MKQVITFLFLVACASCLKHSSARIEENTEQSSVTKARAVTDPNPVNIRLRGFDILSNITTADLDAARSYKANVVRALFTNTSHRFINEKDANGNYSLNANAFTKLDQLVALCRVRNLKLIIDPHTTPGAINPYTGNPGDRLWTDTKLQDMVVEMWRQISNHCHTGSS
ncbi:MAG TPA: cellulase family glycosylhydrolase, partial [Niabella sp.]|nr:cellulase family glycosylhydrolase [Niabella sp.]